MLRTILAAALAAVSGLVHAEAIGVDGARHLLTRAGFGATPAEVAAFAPLGREAAVDRILAGARREASIAPPAFVGEPFVPFYRLRQMSAEERREQQRLNVEQGVALREWWLREMLLTPSPVTERMTLFWHNHFATSQQKVRVSALMYRQNALLRREALGNFATLLHAVAKDPAMLVYLDNAQNRRQAPNENFAREVMELFTLGEGHYGEADIKEAARAFTGWSIDRDAGTFIDRRAWHDIGMKTFLGRSGAFDGDDVLDILLERPETARFVTAKLWKEFVSPTPDAAEVARLAAVFRESRYEVKPLLRALFTSEAFWAPANRAALVKSPTDLVVGTLRTFAIHPMDLRPAVVACASLGQNPMSPPNVKGWPGGDAWINSTTLLARKRILERLFRGSEPAMAPATMEMAAADRQQDGDAAKGRELRARRMLERGLAAYAFDWERWSQSVGATEGLSAQRLLLAGAPVQPLPEGLQGMEIVRWLTSDPMYQLK